MNHYTIGMAGHIDHGKTTLTKALTSIDTDRLKEEKERNISIELGYAPLVLNEMEVSVIDVPGHERFIRQMIAGVAGIDLVLLVVAADEGVMPQTREHIDIVRLLGIEKGILVMTKIERADDEMRELVELDIRENVEGTFLENAPLFLVDSISGEGIDNLKDGLEKELASHQRHDVGGDFRLPIDQVFTVHGQGTVVRGTVYEGTVNEGDILELLPQIKMIRARQLQVHHQPRQQGRAGQRVAINLGGIAKEEIKRGDVLVASGRYEATRTIDIALMTVSTLRFTVKQRTAIKLHIGTAEVYGKIVFFDRNELMEGNEEVLCQLRLNDPVVTKRGDRFIIRRPTPSETIGGGIIIDAHGGQYRFGEETIRALEQKRTATPEEQLINLLLNKKLISMKEARSEVMQSEEEIMNLLQHQHDIIQLPTGEMTSETVIHTLRESIQGELADYHREYPLRQGLKKAELLQGFGQTYPKRLLEWLLHNEELKQVLHISGAYVRLTEHNPHLPVKWKNRIERIIQAIKEENIQVSPLLDHVNNQQIPQELVEELIHYFHDQKIFYKLDDKFSIHAEPFQESVKELAERTDESFTLQEARDILNVSRKYLIPFAEKLDQLGLTTRHDLKRKWLISNREEWLHEK